MKNNRIAIISFSNKGNILANNINKEIEGVDLFSSFEFEGFNKYESLSTLLKDNFNSYGAFIFIGSLGICVRAIAPFLNNKKVDPAVINIDSSGLYVQSVVSGHIGGANELCKKVARITGANPIISTQSDLNELWALDILASKYDWALENTNISLNKAISLFVNENRVALLIESRNKGTQYLENTCPSFVDIYYDLNKIETVNYDLIITVSPYKREFSIPSLNYIPKMMHLGIGCRLNASSEGVKNYISKYLLDRNIFPKSIKSISTIDLKENENLIHELVKDYSCELNIYKGDEIKDIKIKNPSEKVFEVTGCYGIAESCSLKTSNNLNLLIEKQKVKINEGSDFTFALSVDKDQERKGFIEIVGAGPGDPELVSVRGKKYLETADLILYAGSLVPEELTHYAKDGAVVRSSASLNLEEQFSLMKEFYDKGLFVVRLHTGDPCIYGAIQEQMAYFDSYNMAYHITPGISSFQAAAAELKSQFTIPEKIQSIILTRGEGRTPMPDKEKLHMLAKSQSTMCIYLSASIVDKVQKDLLVHYPETTPVAACYKLTWKDQKIFRGELKYLAKIVKDNNLTLTTMIVVGDSIGNREGLSKLYSHKFKHLFRS